MTRPLKFLSIAAVNLVVFLFLSELAGVIYYYAKNHVLYYGRAVDGQAASAVELDSDQPKLVLHPILGYIRSPSLPMSRVATRARLDLLIGPGETPEWWSLRANNYGYFSDHDYPYLSPAARPFVIGIFGGSVAHWFSLQGGQRLIRKLQKSPGFANREIIVLNFGQGGFKQPQNMQALAYFLAIGQRFDLVINLDGFNEIALADQNAKKGVALSLPSAQHLLPLISLARPAELSQEFIATLLAAQQAQERVRSIEQLSAKNSSAGINLILEILAKHAVGDYGSAIARLDDLTELAGGAEFVHINRTKVAEGFPVGAQEETFFAQSTAIWRSSSVLMHRMLKEAGISYLHVIQPNQYFSQRHFSEAERRIAFDAQSPYKPAIERGYYYLLASLGELRRNNVNVASAVALFDKVREPVYADTCCHYNQLGNEILAEFIAEQVLSIGVGRDSAHAH